MTKILGIVLGLCLLVAGFYVGVDYIEPRVGGMVHNVREIFSAGLTLEDDLILENGETIGNDTDGTILLTSDAGTITGENHGLDVTHTGTLSSGDGMVGGNFAVTTAGEAASWVSGVYAKVTQGTTKNVNGYISGAEFEVINTNTNVSDWFPLVLNANSTTNGQHSSYIALRDYGATKIQSLLWIEDQSVGSTSATSLWSTYTDGDEDMTHSLRIIIDDTPYWIMMTNVAPN